MASDATFELIEDAAFSGTTSIRLKGNHIRFRRRNGDDQPLAPLPPIPVRNEQIETLIAALDFLDVWNWKPTYDPIECGCTVCDGMSWLFKAKIAGRECEAGGANAYPSFADTTKASLKVERYAFLVFAIRSVFAIDEHERLAPGN